MSFVDQLNDDLDTVFMDTDTGFAELAIPAGTAANMLTTPDDLSDAAWTATRLSVSSTTEPDDLGDAVAARLTIDSTSSETHLLSELAVVAEASTRYLMGAIVKAEEIEFCELVFDFNGEVIGNYPVTFFELTDDFSTNNIKAAIDVGNEIAGNGYRFVWQIGDTDTSTSINFDIKMAQGIEDGDDTFDTANGTDGLLVTSPFMFKLASDAASIPIIFDAPYYETAPGGNQIGIASSDPTAMMTDDNAALVAIDDQYIIRGTLYKVKGKEPDGTGMTTLNLESQRT